MRLFADAGSTKTHWLLVKGRDILEEWQTEGINPYYLSKEELKESIDKALRTPKEALSIDKIYFFGAGCEPKIHKDLLTQLFSTHFPQSSIHIGSDLEGAGRALFGTNSGISCILGTGSNSCLWSEEKIQKNVNSLGLYLGDEGSGGYMGKKWVSLWLRGQLPQDLEKSTQSFCQKNLEEVLSRIYKEAYPNRFLASFFPIISSNKEHIFVKKFIHSCLNDFFENCLKLYPQEHPLGFVGSVAYLLKEELIETAKNHHRNIISIEKEPVYGLLKNCV